MVYSKKNKKGAIDVTFGKLTLFLDKHALRSAADASADKVRSSDPKEQSAGTGKQSSTKEESMNQQREEKTRGTKNKAKKTTPKTSKDEL